MKTLHTIRTGLPDLSPLVKATIGQELRRGNRVRISRTPVRRLLKVEHYIRGHGYWEQGRWINLYYAYMTTNQRLRNIADFERLKDMIELGANL